MIESESESGSLNISASKSFWKIRRAAMAMGCHQERGALPHVHVATYMLAMGAMAAFKRSQMTSAAKKDIFRISIARRVVDLHAQR